MQELNKTPEKYLLKKSIDYQQNDDHLSDSGSWGTDFEDDVTDENSHTEELDDVIKSSSIMDKHTFSQNNKDISRIPTQSPKKIIKSENEETYANFEPCQNEENLYANFQNAKSLPPKNVSRLHSQVEKSLSEDGLKRINNQSIGKPTISPKPEILLTRKIQTTSERKLPQKSFLHNAQRINQHIPNDMQS